VLQQVYFFRTIKSASIATAWIERRVHLHARHKSLAQCDYIDIATILQDLAIGFCIEDSQSGLNGT
jgi:hypothetical protein